MILCSEETIAQYTTSGVWGSVTLDALVKRAAQTNPHQLALVDAPDRAQWTGGKPRKLTFKQAEEEINRIAAFFSAVGLEPDKVIGIQAPNTVDTVLTMLGAWRAGLIVSPFPLHWRHREILQALSTVGAKAFITADRIEARFLGEDARDAAADYFSLKFVFGLGSSVPDGVLELAPLVQQYAEAAETVGRSADKNAANHIATLTWIQTKHGPAPVPRSHNHWISAGLMPFLEARLKTKANLVVPFVACGMTGIGAGLVPWLLSEGTLHLHHPIALHSLTDHARTVDADYVLVPGALAPHIDEALQGWNTAVTAVWSPTSTRPARYKSNGTFIDLHVLEDFGFVAKLRGTNVLPNKLELGNVHAPSGNIHGPVLMSLDTLDNGDETLITLQGAMVPSANWPDAETCLELTESGCTQTNLPVQIANGAISDFGRTGTIAPDSSELPHLDMIYSAFPGVSEAAAFLVEDEVLGARLMVAVVPSEGATVDVDAFYAYLDAERVSLAMLPHRIFSLRSLPRSEAGEVDRTRLARRSQPREKTAVA
ncbi:MULTISPECIES: AMP-binding protein [Pseudovibrio]|uniref:AMP-binding protein n=1 Tax=Stappiaceae TaxID=2821832 RepID=UPI00236688B1|nr:MULTISPECIES: class I adenylate-forming enzyme family protein [Pseudovibrio]MDD7908786.1 class I adenylate-forming enzyme family protein [Pseudovibrio exalbescens]MDX5592859.1 class I adenylate-forming enzyme family protein [Pseudovibrio sp. SPO723]